MAPVKHQVVSTLHNNYIDLKILVEETQSSVISKVSCPCVLLAVELLIPTSQDLDGNIFRTQSIERVLKLQHTQDRKSVV